MPNTSTYALTNATLPYALELATRAWPTRCARDPALARGVNTVGGNVTNDAVAEALGKPVTALADALGI